MSLYIAQVGEDMLRLNRRFCQACTRLFSRKNKNCMHACRQPGLDLSFKHIADHYRFFSSASQAQHSFLEQGWFWFANNFRLNATTSRNCRDHRATAWYQI